MNVMKYKGFSARIEYSENDECFVGHMTGIRDVIGFHGVSVSELKATFKEAINDYVATCEKLGRSPQKPYSGKIMLRLDSALHAKIALLAESQGKSLNAWAQEVFSQISDQ